MWRDVFSLFGPGPGSMALPAAAPGAGRADAYNRRACGIGQKRLDTLSAEELTQDLGFPRRLLLQGEWPMLPLARDARPRLWEGLLARYCAGMPALLLYTRPQSPALTAFSRLCRGQEARGGIQAARGAGLLGGMPLDLLLDGLMGAPGSGTEYELLGFLEKMGEWFWQQGQVPTPRQMAELLRRPSPLLALCPPPQDGQADPLALPYAQREALARRFDLLGQESPGAPGPSLYHLLRRGQPVSWLCTPATPMTRRLLAAQILRLDREGVPFCLVLDEPRGGWWGQLLAGLSGTRVLCRCDLPPGWPLENPVNTAEAFGALVSQFEGVALAGVGQAAPLWAGWIGSYDRLALTGGRTRGFQLDMRLLFPGLGWHRDRSLNASYQSHRRMEEDQLRLLLDQGGRGLLAGRDGRFTLYR